MLDIEEEEIEGINLNPEFVLALITTIIACIADAVTVYILRRFKKLQKQHHNVYIFHISVLNLLYFAVRVVYIVCINIRLADKQTHGYSYKRYNDVFVSKDPPKGWLILLIHIMASLVFAQLSLYTIMTVDWYMYTFAPQKSAIFRKFKNTIIISTYSYVLTVNFYSIVEFLWHGNVSGLVLSGVFQLGNILLSLILYLVFGSIYLCQRKRLPSRTSAVVLNISLIKVLLWLFFIIAVGIQEVSSNKLGILHSAVVLFWLLLIMSPALQLVLFYFWDPNYKVALSRIFCCRKPSQMEDGIDLEESMQEGAAVYTTNDGEVVV